MQQRVLVSAIKPTCPFSASSRPSSALGLSLVYDLNDSVFFDVFCRPNFQKQPIILLSHSNFAFQEVCHFTPPPPPCPLISSLLHFNASLGTDSRVLHAMLCFRSLSLHHVAPSSLLPYLQARPKTLELLASTPTFLAQPSHKLN